MKFNLVAICVILACASTGPIHGQSPSNYLGNNQRSGYTGANVPDSPTLRWTLTERHPPRHAWREPNREEQYIDFDYATQVAIDGELVVFGSSADHTVRAVDLKTGNERWHFYTEGPVRFAPVIDGHRVLVTSDDGCLYCLNRDTGDQIWRFRGGPSDGKLIGNDQMISHWPARSGVLLDGDKIYFTAGMWSRDGVFIYCLSEKDGSVLWKNDTSGFHFATLPHASGFAGVAPQGYLALNRNRLYVPTGRGAPACFDARTGELLFYENGHGYKPHQPGGSRVMAWKDWVIFKRRSQHTEESVRYDSRLAAGGAASGLYALDFRSGDPAWSLTDKNVVVGHGRHMILGGAGPVIKVDLNEVLEGYEKFWKNGKNLGPDRNLVDQHLDYTRTSPGGKLIPNPAWMTPVPYAQWQADVGQVFVMLQAGRTILAGGPNQIAGIDSDSGEVLWQRKVDGDVRGICAVDGAFVVSTVGGKLYCFGSADQTTAIAATEIVPQEASLPSTDPHVAGIAESILSATNIRSGYALMLGAGDGQLLLELAKQSDLMIYCLEPDPQRVLQMQTLLDEAGLLGVRAAVHHGNFEQLPYNPYIANLIIWGDPLGSSTERLTAKELHRVLRPYGGTAVQLAGPATQSEARRWLLSGEVPERELSVGGASAGLGLIVARGPLEGAGEWTHPYADIGRTSSSEDTLAKLPLGMLWWGGPGPGRIVSRHWRAPIPLFAAGVLYIQGQHDVIAVDAYNGREMWNRHLPGIGRFPANKRGGNIVADQTSVFCVLGTKCLRLGAKTGETIQDYEFPVSDEHLAAIEELKNNDTKSTKDSRIVWEYLGLSGNSLIGTLSYEIVGTDTNPDAHAPQQAKFVFAFDKASGQLRWQQKLERAVSSVAIVADADHLYLLDRTDERIYQRLRRRGQSEFSSSLKAISLKTGETRWTNPTIDMTRKALLLKSDVIVAYPNPTEDEPEDSDTGVSVYSAASGKIMWEETHSPLLADERRGHLNRYTFAVGDTLFLPDARELHTGKKILLRKNPLTGETSPFDLCGKNFCGSIAASREMLAFRSASVGFQEIERDSGAFWLPEIRPSCWISVVPAGGLVLAPEGYSTCICPYNYKTSLALVPVERYEDWSIYLTGRQDKRAGARNRKSQAAAASPNIHQMRVNFNAPGDRMDDDSNIWFAFPRPIQLTKKRYLDTELPIEVSGIENRFRHNADLHAIGGTAKPWLFTSGVEGPVHISVQLSSGEAKPYDVQLLFAETDDAIQGDRVFDIKVQGETVAQGYDIAGESAGTNRATTFSLKGVAARGELTIEMIPVSGRPPRVCSLVITETKNP